MASGLENIETIESPFRRFVTTIGVFPTAFTDAMTYYECLAYLVKYIEDTVIPAVNENAEALEELQQYYTQLKSYVDNYFANLDVQEEINNKLDAMAEAGTLQEIITSYLQANVAWTFDTVADMKQATNLVNGSFARTLGFHAVNDGGGALYKITNTGTANEMDVIAVGSLYANLIDGDEINVKQYGAIEGATDSYAIIRYCLTKGSSASKTVKALGEYTLSSQLLFDDNNRETFIFGKLNFPNGDGIILSNQYKTILIKGGMTAKGRCIYVAGNTLVSPRYIQRIKVAGYEDNKPVLVSDTAPCLEIESNNRGVGYGAFDNLVCGSATTSKSPALYIHTDTNNSFANNLYFNDCCFNVCGNDRWMAELVGYTAFTIESNYFFNTSFESAETNAAGGLLLENIAGCNFVNCRYQEHYIRSHKKYMKLKGRTYDNTFDTCLSSRIEAFELDLLNEAPCSYNYFRNSRLLKTIDNTDINLCSGFSIASDNTFRYGEPLQNRSNYIVNTGGTDKTIGIESDSIEGSKYKPAVWFTSESNSVVITLTDSYIKQFAEFDLYWSYYYRPSASKTITIKSSGGQILDTINSNFTNSGELAHVHYDFKLQYGAVSLTYKTTSVITSVNPTSA